MSFATDAFLDEMDQMQEVFYDDDFDDFDQNNLNQNQRDALKFQLSSNNQE